MTPPRPCRDSERGGAVILFVALVVAVAIAAAAAMIARQPQFAVEQAAGTGMDLATLRKAVEAHAVAINGGAVACPDFNGDGDDEGQAAPCPAPPPPNLDWLGPVPWKSIGVAERQARDTWGRQIFLVVTGTALTLETPQRGAQAGCDFLLISAGANGAWDFDREPAAGTPSRIILDGPADVADPADVDIAICGSLGGEEGGGRARTDMPITTPDSAQHSAMRRKTAPHSDWADDGGEVDYFGGSSDDPDTYDLTAANVSKTACAWTRETFPFTSEVLRGYVRFQFLPGEASASQTEGTNQGFALMVVPGSRMADGNPDDGVDPTAECGTAASDNAFGFKGVARPKVAVEFDIYRDAYEGMNDHSGGRDNPRPEGNHVAVLNPLNNDYISHGGSGNPSCQDWGTYGTGPAMDGGIGACTYPPGDANQYTPSGADPRPARHAVRPANWLEDKPYMDTGLGRTAAQPYQTRFEIRRRCNADCSVCGVEDNANISMQVKVWVACDSILDGNPNGCPVLPDDFDDLDSLYDDTTDYMVNSCVPDRSLKAGGGAQTYPGGPTPPENFDTVRVGIGFSSRNAAVALILHRFEVTSEDPADE